ncbi:Rhomboid-domain-containing protein [Pleurostoma richardsiae]|uniref:Rhomboid-domain-containing protein n=1 Tax=Pleurostoma richardsiae TaxID=41990 RepID=A0AA38RVD5_9PEZI|nr:Rhomboid-domain-containing protein [Pleurostoma richardsiae]
MSVFFGISSSRPTLPSLARLVSICAASAAETPVAARSYACIARRAPPYSIPFGAPDQSPRPRQWPIRQIPARAGFVRSLSIFDGAVIKHYVDLPPDYRDEVGLPFRKSGDLTKDEVLSVFGPGTSTRSANKLLRILHGRRVAGTLEDPAFRRHTAQYRDSQVQTALAYLRKTAPVDEIINAGLRAEDELQALEEAAAAARKADDANGDEIIATPEKENTDKEEVPRRAGLKPANDDVYGVGVFDKIRARNIAIREEEERRLEEERRKREEEASQNMGGLARIDADKPLGLVTPEMSPTMKEWQAKGQSQLAEAPEMSKAARLGPSALFVTLFVAGLAALAEFYLPPKSEYRLFPDIPPSAATVLTLMAINLLVYVSWKIPPLWPVLNRYFILVPATPRPLAVVGAMFSHQKVTHLMINMLFLWFFGTRLHDEVGRGAFLAAYLSSGSLGFLATMANIVLRGNLHLSTLGASGAIYGVTTAYFWLHRFEGFKILGLPPDPYRGVQGLGFIGLLLSLNLAALLPGRGEHMIDVVSHMGGMGAGLACAALLEKRREARKRERGEVQEASSAASNATERIIRKE